MARSRPTIQCETGLERKLMLNWNSLPNRKACIFWGVLSCFIVERVCPGLLWHYPPQAYWQIINGNSTYICGSPRNVSTLTVLTIGPIGVKAGAWSGCSLWGGVFCRKLSRTLAPHVHDTKRPKITPQTLCEPVQSKCTWTCHKNHVMREFTTKMPQSRWRTLIWPRS